MVCFDVITCLRIPLFYLNSYLRLTKTSTMPFYAVARGKRVGIYSTYEECSAQVKNFPNAKFKKFNIKEDAEKFISENKDNYCVSLPQTYEKVQVENRKPVESFPVEKISPSNTLFNNLGKRVTLLEDRLNKFVNSTNEQLEILKRQICEIVQTKLPEDLQPCSSSTSEIKTVKKIKLDPEIKDNLMTNEKGFVIVYTDGACVNNGKMGAKAGIGVWFNDGHPLNVSAPVRGPATNNNAEIQAARVAIKQAAKANVKKLLLHTDSKFVINCITQWIHKWKKNDWKLSTGGVVKNRVELEKLDAAIQNLVMIEWKYVAGHRGIEGNEKADQLARRGAQEYNINITYSNMEPDEDDLFDDVDFPEDI